MAEIKSIKDHKKKQKNSDMPYARCEEIVNGQPCGSYAFVPYRVFQQRPDGKLIPEERQICANPRCQKEFIVNYGEMAYDM